MKTIAVIVLATLSTAMGEALISIGMKQIGDISNFGLLGFWKIFYMFANPRVLMGIVFMACFFFLYSAALSWADLSFAQPMTALTFVWGIILARIFLHENVSQWRWMGAALIVLGVVLISLDQSQLTKEASAAPNSSPTAVTK